MSQTSNNTRESRVINALVCSYQDICIFKSINLHDWTPSVALIATRAFHRLQLLVAKQKSATPKKTDNFATGNILNAVQLGKTEASLYCIAEISH